MDLIKNRVAESSLITMDIEEMIDQSERVSIDLKDFLFDGLVLKEKDFRQQLKEMEWESFAGKNVLIHCSSEAIIPSWAYMLIVSRLTGSAHVIAVGDDSALEKALIDQALKKLDTAMLEDKKVVIKGCGSLQLREYYYTEITKLLTPVAATIMYGEPCSTVPVYKKARKR